MRSHQPKIHSYRTKVNELEDAPLVKKCTRGRKGLCKVGDILQPISEFNRLSNTADGYNATCRSCKKADAKASNEKLKDVRNNNWLKIIIG